jgi:hypothetical protein
MSRSRSNKQQPGQGPGRTSPPTSSARSIRTGTLLALVAVDLIVALMMVVSSVGFVLDPDPAVKAGPMYVTLAFTTGAALLMFAMALNASFFPFLTRERVPSVNLVMWTMAATGIVVGLLTVGREAAPFVTRLVLGSVAYAFVMVQNARLARAREAARTGPADAPAPHTPPRPRSRQRRGGRTR